MSNRYALATVLAFGLSLLAEPAPAWDRGVRARKSLRQADRLYNAHAYREAMEKYREATKSRDAATAERAWSQLAECAEKAGRYKEALDARAHSLGMHLAADDKAGIAQTLRKMGETHAFLGDYRKSERVLDLSREVPSGAPGRSEKAEAYRSLSVAYGALGRYQEQHAAAQAALELFRQLGDPAGEALAHGSLAQYHQSQGEFDKALEQSEKALEAAKRSKVPDLAPAYLIRAGVFRARGDIRQALAIDQQALDAARKSGVSEAIAVAQANLGADEMAFGEYDKANEALDGALALFRESGAADDQARTLLELGRVAYFQRQHETALERLKEARALFAASNQPVGVAVCDAAAGRVLESMGRPAEALAAHEQALAAYRAAGEAAGVARETVERGFALAALGRRSEALEAFRAGAGQPARAGEGSGAVGPSFKIALASGDPRLRGSGTPAAAGQTADPDVPWRALQGRGRVLAASGDVDGAIQSYKAAAEKIEALLVRARVPEMRSSFLAGEDRLRVYDEAIDLLASRGRAEAALEFSERARARSFLDLVSGARVDLREGADASLLAEERRVKEQILDLTAKAARQNTGAGGFDARLAALREEYDRVLEKIAGESPSLASLVTVKPATLAQAKAALEPGDRALYYHLGPERAWIFTLDRGSLSMKQAPMPARELRALVRVFRIQLEQRLGAGEAGAELYRALVAPVEGHLGGSRVVVVPHDVLHYVPLAALTDASGRYLIEKRAVSVAPSLSSLVALAGRAGKPGGRLLAAGAPEAGKDVPELPQSADEVRRVAARYPGARVLLGKEASEAAIKQEAPAAGAIHLACHGFLETDLPMHSALALTPSEGEDGRLELHEIFGMRLQSRLTVLSACTTAVGHLSKGDELVGLSRAFLYAGSPGVVASLWSVSDESTAKFMDVFHTRLTAGENRAEALRGAALALLSDPKTAEPYFWAPFELIGR